MRAPLYQRYTSTDGIRLDTGEDDVAKQTRIVDFIGSGARTAGLFVRGDEREASIDLHQTDVRALRDGMSRWLASLENPSPCDRAVNAVVREMSHGDEG